MRLLGEPQWDLAHIQQQGRRAEIVPPRDKAVPPPKAQTIIMAEFMEGMQGWAINALALWMNEQQRQGGQPRKELPSIE